MESAAGARHVWTLVVGSCTAVSRTWFALPGTSRTGSHCVGLRQGCPLAHILFIILMDTISRRSLVMGFHLGTPHTPTTACSDSWPPQTVPWPEVQRCAGLWKLLANRHKTEHFYRTGSADMLQLSDWDASWTSLGELHWEEIHGQTQDYDNKLKATLDEQHFYAVFQLFPIFVNLTSSCQIWQIQH